MNIPDVINGVFEAIGGFVILLSVRKVLQDRQVHGVHWGHVLFFVTWGWWNLYYYPHLDQWYSAAGAGGVALANTAWMILIMKYGFKRRP